MSVVGAVLLLFLYRQFPHKANP
ncbi:MAG TPA: hypothetical protein VFQ91_08215 [Bryobacteraceae bacterium]|nr:hypothetical protein [Bryobacteraceae bacterium]